MRQVTLLLLLLIVLLTGCGRAEESVAGTQTAAPTRTPTPEIGVTLITRAPPTVAVIQTTPTPLPTATATPTPTPVVYHVEEGDTLLGIAIENYTTVEEIEALNPNVVAELLQIGQPLILPPPATPVYSGALPTSIPLQIKVHDVQLIRTPVGSMWLLGEIVNEGDFPAAGVQLQIDLLGAEGESLLSVPAWIIPAVVPGKATAPFAVLVPEAPSAEVQPAVSVVAGDGLASLGSYYLDLAVASPEVTIEEGQISLDGAVENVGQQVAAQITVVATFYDAQQRVTGYAKKVLENPLGPGESASFAVEAAPPGGPTTDYSLQVYGLVQP